MLLWSLFANRHGNAFLTFAPFSEPPKLTKVTASGNAGVIAISRWVFSVLFSPLWSLFWSFTFCLRTGGQWPADYGWDQRACDYPLVWASWATVSSCGIFHVGTIKSQLKTFKSLAVSSGVPAPWRAALRREHLKWPELRLDYVWEWLAELAHLNQRGSPRKWLYSFWLEGRAGNIALIWQRGKPLRSIQ